MDREGNLGPGLLSTDSSAGPRGDAGSAAEPARLQRLSESLGVAWLWTRPKVWRRRYELKAGDALLAVLESRATLRSDTSVESATGRWRMRHEGLLRGRVRVLHEGHAGDAAVFQPRWFGAGDVTMARGDVLRWKRADFWGRRWEFVDSGGLTRVAFSRAPAFFSLDVRVEVGAHAVRDEGELEPLVMLGFYLLLLMARQAHAAH